MVTRCEGEAGRGKLNVFETSPLATEAATFLNSLLSTASKLETSKTVTPLRMPFQRRTLVFKFMLDFARSPWSNEAVSAT